MSRPVHREKCHWRRVPTRNRLAKGRSWPAWRIAFPELITRQTLIGADSRHVPGWPPPIGCGGHDAGGRHARFACCKGFFFKATMLVLQWDALLFPDLPYGLLSGGLFASFSLATRDTTGIP
jgi:hypothetical protein